jgi:PAS domain S-box-containing protein
MLDGIYLGAQSGTARLRFSDPSHGVTFQSYTAWAVPMSEELDNGLVIQVSDPAEETLMERRCEEAQEEMRAINERLLIAGLRQHELADVATKAQQRLHDLVHGVNAIVCEVDAETGKFTFISERAQSFLGYSIDRWNEPDFWRRVIHPDYYESAMKGFEAARRDGNDHQYEFPIESADGTAIWLRNIVRVVHDLEGSVVKLRSVIVDVTVEKQALGSLARAFHRERRIAEALQYSVLFEEPEDLFPGWSVVSIYEPASEEALVGGDFFDALSLPSGQMMLVVGDVTGKGVKAAARTVEVKYALRAFAQDHEIPSEAAARLNDYICRRHGETAEHNYELIALVLAVISPTDGIAQFISAGAEPPIIVRASGDTEQVPTSGMMLGVQPGLTYTRLVRPLNSGDLLILTTDGITEARCRGDFFGYHRIGQIVKDADPAMSLRDLGKTIVNAAREHAGGVFRDDICILLARCK